MTPHREGAVRVFQVQHVPCVSLSPSITHLAQSVAPTPIRQGPCGGHGLSQTPRSAVSMGSRGLSIASVRLHSCFQLNHPGRCLGLLRAQGLCPRNTGSQQPSWGWGQHHTTCAVCAVVAQGSCNTCVVSHDTRLVLCHTTYDMCDRVTQHDMHVTVSHSNDNCIRSHETCYLH